MKQPPPRNPVPNFPLVPAIDPGGGRTDVMDARRDDQTFQLGAACKGAVGDVQDLGPRSAIRGAWRVTRRVGGRCSLQVFWCLSPLVFVMSAVFLGGSFSSPKLFNIGVSQCSSIVENLDID